MKVFRRFFALVLAVVLLAPGGFANAQARDTTSPGAIPAQIRTLPNGLRVVVLEDHAAPVVQVAMWYRFGSDYETPGKTGLAHGLEHMMFRGTPSLSSAGLDDLGARLGGLFNANTTNEYTHYYFVVPADRLDLMIHVEADRMHDLRLSAQDWATEKQAVLQEFDQDYSQPLIKFLFGVNDAVYPGTPYGKSALGVRADIVNSTVADLRRYYAQWYAPNNATLVVTGDVHAADVFASAARWFGPIPRKPLPQVKFPAATAAGGATVAVNAEFPFQILDLAYALPGNNPQTEVPLMQAEMALFALENPRGPLRTALVDSGLTLGFLFFRFDDRPGSIAHALFIVAPGHTVAEVRAAYDKTLVSVLAGGLDPEFVAAAKRSYVNGVAFGRDSITGYGNSTGACYVFPGDSDDTKSIAIANAVTADQADAAIKTYFAKPNAVGTLTPTTTDPAKAKTPSDLSGAVADNFSGRVPNGPIVQAPWVKAGIQEPLALNSTVKPQLFRLDNGLRLFVQEVHTNPTVFVNGHVRRFERADPTGREGLGAIVSALLEYGSSKYDFAAQRKLADDLGAQLSFGSSFAAHGFAKDSAALIDALADSLQHPRFPENRFSLVKAQAAAAIARRQLDPNYRSGRAFSEALYPAGDPALRETSAASIAAIGLDDVRAYHGQWYRPDLTTLVVVGDVDAQTVRQIVETALGGWTASGPKPTEILAPLPLPSPVAKIVESQAGDDSVELGSTALAFSNPDRTAFQLMNAILGNGGFDSRLMEEARQKRGLVYGISSRLDANAQRGTWVVNFRSVPAKTEAAVEVVKHEMRRMQLDFVSLPELERQKIRITARAAIEEESTASIVGDIRAIASNDLPLDYYATLGARYAAITPADIRRVAGQYLHPDNLVEVVTGPKP
ncbi:MAG: pitrilysin family protein [Candidatus Velthaea sp.]